MSGPPIIYHDYMERWEPRKPRNRAWGIVALVLVGLLMLMTSCLLSPYQKFYPEHVEVWWDMGYEDVKCYGVKKVSYERFIFVPNPLPSFRCGYVAESVGCFHTPNTIEYSTLVPNVLRHEAAHAILYTAGFKVPEAQRCWATIGHDKGDGCDPCKN